MAGREVGAADDAAGRCRRGSTGPATARRIPPRVPSGDLDDQRFDVDLRAALVELVDHGAQVAVHRLGRGDDERVGRRVGLDGRGRAARWCAGGAGRGAGGGRGRGAEGAPWASNWRSCVVLRDVARRRAARAASRRSSSPRRCAATRRRCCPRRRPGVSRPAASALMRDHERRVVGAHDEAVGARIHGDRGLGAACPGAVGEAHGLGDHALQDLRDVDGRGVLQADHLHLARGRAGRSTRMMRSMRRTLLRVVGDDDRVVVGIGRDEVVGGDERAQHGHELHRRSRSAG